MSGGDQGYKLPGTKTSLKTSQSKQFLGLDLSLFRFYEAFKSSCLQGTFQDALLDKFEKLISKNFHSVNSDLFCLCEKCISTVREDSFHFWIGFLDVFMENFMKK